MCPNKPLNIKCSLKRGSVLNKKNQQQHPPPPLGIRKRKNGRFMMTRLGSSSGSSSLLSLWERGGGVLSSSSITRRSQENSLNSIPSTDSSSSSSRALLLDEYYDENSNSSTEFDSMAKWQHGQNHSSLKDEPNSHNRSTHHGVTEEETKPPLPSFTLLPSGRPSSSSSPHTTINHLLPNQNSTNLITTTTLNAINLSTTTSSTRSTLETSNLEEGNNNHSLTSTEDTLSLNPHTMSILVHHSQVKSFLIGKEMLRAPHEFQIQFVHQLNQDISFKELIQRASYLSEYFLVMNFDLPYLTHSFHDALLTAQTTTTTTTTTTNPLWRSILPFLRVYILLKVVNATKDIVVSLYL
nr:unnamed protein product [Naegleria fowleri]